MSIPPINGPGGLVPPGGNHNSNLLNEMEKMLQEFRNQLVQCESDPSSHNVDQLAGFSYQLRSFMESHKEQIFSEAKANGWPAHGGMKADGYEDIFNGCMDGINTILNPSLKGTLTGKLDFTNEQLTQITWLVKTPNISPFEK